MTLTPVVKGQLTKAVKAGYGDQQAVFTNVKKVFLRVMPAEQAKHAARKFVSSSKDN